MPRDLPRLPWRSTYWASWSTATRAMNAGQWILNWVDKQPLQKQQRLQPGLELVVMSVMFSSRPDNILTQRLSPGTSQQYQISDSRSVLIFQFIFSSPSTLSPVYTLFSPHHALRWIAEFLLLQPSSSMSWQNVVHTAFGQRSVEHLESETKNRIGTWRQTQPPTAIFSPAILIAGVEVWVIPSVMHYEALTSFHAQLKTLHGFHDKQAYTLCGRYAAIDQNLMMCDNSHSILWQGEMPDALIDLFSINKEEHKLQTAGG